ncbi:MAG: response regulator [Burkholderiales bacterium]
MPASPTFTPPAPQPNAPLVVIADDSRLVRIKLSRLLTAAGFRVAEATNGQEALDMLQRGELPSVLITDLEMPSMDGFELIAAVHGAIETEHVPIVAITANEDLQARVGDLSGVYGIFRKPWNDRALIQRVRALSVVAYAH